MCWLRGFITGEARTAGALHTGESEEKKDLLLRGVVDKENGPMFWAVSVSVHPPSRNEESGRELLQLIRHAGDPSFSPLRVLGDG